MVAMAKNDHSFEDFLSEVAPQYKGFVKGIHDSLMKEGYKAKTELKASGFFVSYSHPKSKRSLLNFFFRKNGLKARIYADNHDEYKDILNDLPKSMVDEIEKAHVCKRLIDPNECSPTCAKGFDFFIKGVRYQKCRYGCFEFVVTEENVPVLSEFIEKECSLRRSG
jgi:hypothetical protein